MLHPLSGVLAEFGQLRVHMISQSSNNLNLTFVVDEGVVDALLPHLHELLIGAGALRTDDSAAVRSELAGRCTAAARRSTPAAAVVARGERERLLRLAPRQRRATSTTCRPCAIRRAS